MSRSYKKAIFKDHNAGMKRVANKAVRNHPDVPMNGGYRKVFCSYSISDYTFDMRWGKGDWLPPGSVRTRAGWRVPK